MLQLFPKHLVAFLSYRSHHDESEYESTLSPSSSHEHNERERCLLLQGTFGKLLCMVLGLESSALGLIA